MCLTIVRQVGHNAPHISITYILKIKKLIRNMTQCPKCPYPTTRRLLDRTLPKVHCVQKDLLVPPGCISLIGFFKYKNAF